MVKLTSLADIARFNCYYQSSDNICNRIEFIVQITLVTRLAEIPSGNDPGQPMPGEDSRISYISHSVFRHFCD